MKQKEIQVVNPSLQLEPKITTSICIYFVPGFFFLDGLLAFHQVVVFIVRLLGPVRNTLQRRR